MVATRRPRRPAEHVVARPLDGVERGPASGDERRDRERRAAAQGAHERKPFVEQRARPVDLERDQRPQPAARRGLREVALVAAEASHVGGRNIDPAAGRILGHVLPVLGELEPAADRIGKAEALGRRRAEDMEHEVADGVGRELAVGEEVVDRLVALDLLILAVGVDQPAEGLGGDPAFADGRREAAYERMGRGTGVDLLELVIEPVEQFEAVSCRLVAGVVDQASEAIEGE